MVRPADDETGMADDADAVLRRRSERGTAVSRRLLALYVGMVESVK